MKTKLTLFVLCALGFNSFAQNAFVCDFQEQNQTVSTGGTMYFVGSVTNEDCCDAVDINQAVISADLPDGWYITLCNPSGCFPEGTLSDSFVMEGEQSGEIDIVFHTNENDGTGTVVVRFENTADNSDFVEFTLIGTTPGVTAIAGVEKSVGLSQNYPNPFEGSTTIELFVEEYPSSLQITDLMGRKVATIPLTLGEQIISIGSGLSSGSYIYAVVSSGRILDARTMTVK